MENLMKIQEVANILNVTTSTLRRWDKNGKLKALRTFGNQRRYKTSDVEKIINGN